MGHQVQLLTLLETCKDESSLRSQEMVSKFSDRLLCSPTTFHPGSSLQYKLLEVSLADALLGA